MRYYLPLALCLILTTACSKNKKSCWRCEFATSASGVGWSDTTICNMTEAESKTFQQDHVKKLKEEYGFPSGTEVTSACNKTPYVR